jgi:hypothetical protein
VAPADSVAPDVPTLPTELLTDDEVTITARTIAPPWLANAFGGLHGGVGFLTGAHTLDLAMRQADAGDNPMRTVDVRASFLRPIPADGRAVESTATMLCEIDRTVGFDAAGAARVRDLAELRAFVSQFPPERVAAVVGVDPGTIVATAQEFAAAPTASAHCSTGVNMGRHGALAYWLLHMLVLLTGNLDRTGGNIAVARATSPTPRSGAAGPDGFVASPWGSYRPNAGGQPGALLGDMIRAGENPIRAFICVAGNPALSIGGGRTLGDALASLDLLVTVDYYRNATGELADYVLPAADWFEREDLNTFVQGTQPEPFVQWTPSLVPPQGECRTEWEIFAGLTERLGLESILGPDTDILAALHDGALAQHGLSMAALRTADRNLSLLPARAPGGFLDEMTEDGTLDGSPEMLAPARRRSVKAFEELSAEASDQLKLITSAHDQHRPPEHRAVEEGRRGEQPPVPVTCGRCEARRSRRHARAGRERLRPRGGARPHRRHAPAGRRRDNPRLRQRRHHGASRGSAPPRRERQRTRTRRSGIVRPGQHHVAADRNPCHGHAALREVPADRAG